MGRPTNFALLGSGLSNTTNIAPNGLGTVSPYPTPFVANPPIGSPSSAWTTQTATYCKALFPRGAQDGSGDKPIKLHFEMSTAGATVAVYIWTFNRTSGTWGQAPNADGSLYTTVTDNDIRALFDAGEDPIFIQLGTPSAGTVSIYYDNALAVAA